ncbi:hypothetical protein BSLG_000087 [Batrachochytrium salamandrivorans]|nr:hypothetical protein BSLG_001643 [Batrachochytrium salamandrivorans]KAJ1344563.1 hypothetical protein BSLG_000087 [Batrachochytrium salamandrivorans]
MAYTEKLLVTLRDGRHLYGWLRSYDMFANLVLQDTVERTFIDKTYSDVYRGVFAIRGENVVLLGEIDPEKDAAALRDLTEVPAAEALGKLKQEKETKKRRKVQLDKILASKGFYIAENEHDAY